MRVHVDHDRCEGHGLCADAAPELFELDDDAVVVLRITGEIPAALEAKAETGARRCPVMALRVID